MNPSFQPQTMTLQQQLQGELDHCNDNIRRLENINIHLGLDIDRITQEIKDIPAIPTRRDTMPPYLDLQSGTSANETSNTMRSLNALQLEIMSKKTVLLVQQGRNKYLNDKLSQLRAQRNHLRGRRTVMAPLPTFTTPTSSVVRPARPHNASHSVGMDTPRTPVTVQPFGVPGTGSRNSRRTPLPPFVFPTPPVPAPAPAPAPSDENPPTDKNSGEMFTRIMNASTLEVLYHSFARMRSFAERCCQKALTAGDISDVLKFEAKKIHININQFLMRESPQSCRGEFVTSIITRWLWERCEAARMLAAFSAGLNAQYQQLNALEAAGIITSDEWTKQKATLFTAVVNAPQFAQWVVGQVYQQINDGDSTGLAYDLMMLLGPMFHAFDYDNIFNQMKLIVTEFIMLCFRMEMEPIRWQLTWVYGSTRLNNDIMEAANLRTGGKAYKVKVGTTPVVKSFVNGLNERQMGVMKLEMRARVWLNESE